jgi:ATP-binding cassette subfamily C protein
MIFGITFQVQPGQLLGIIGPSGAGKTTLAKVIAGAIPADVGTVRVDGAKLSDWDQDKLARHIGFLPQEGTLFEGSVKENISRFDAATEDIDEQVVSAAKSAGVHDLILKLPKGYDTRLGPLGHGLSAGQAQRIALARALYGNPSLLIFDEPNAFLDGEGEAALLKSIESALKRKASVILIAHRRSVLKDATHLLVLEGGRQKLSGPANEVAARLAPPAKERAS